MKKLISLTLALVLIVTCLSGLVFAADPIAKVETNGKTVEVETLADLAASIDASGKSVVTLLKDITTEELADLPYTCTFDLNGHKLTNTKTNALNIKAAGSENKVTTVKNGTIDGAMSAFCWRNGALVVDNCTLIGRGSAAIQILNHKKADSNAADYKDISIVKNSILASTIWVTVSFNSTGNDFSDVVLTFENTDLYATKNNPPLSNQGKETKPGTYNLGKGVNFYTLGTAYAKTSAPAPTLTGEPVTQAAGTFSIEFAGEKYDGLNKFSTPEMPAPVVPETPAQPETPATPSVPSTGTPDVTVPATGVSVVALGVMAMVSLAGAALTKKH